MVTARIFGAGKIKNNSDILPKGTSGGVMCFLILPDSKTNKIGVVFGGNARTLSITRRRSSGV
jgi:hypothetical protein